MKKYLSIVTAAALAVTFNACGSDNDKEVKTTKVAFSPITTPTTDSQKKSVRTSSSVSVDGQSQNLFFTKLMATNTLNNNETFGLVKDFQDLPISFEDGAPYICNGTNSGVGSGLDYTSILQKNSKLYMVSQFECQVGAMYKAELEQDAKTGKLSVKDDSLEFISQKAGFGGFVHCAGQRTPWESHLGSEEYETDARFVENSADAAGLTGNKYYDETSKYWGGDATKMSPYYYGWTPEVTIASNGKAVYTKHYSMGRMSHELSFVMPDKKTVYQSDDGTNVGFFMYKADKSENLSAGTLYAAKWKQTSSANGGSADISWIKLGHATDSEIKAILDPDGNVNTNDAPLFSDIFTTAEVGSAGTCPTGFNAINTSVGFECLSLKSGMEQTAAFLETRRYASYMGATTEFRKEEGITYSPQHNKLYVAMSAIAYGMEDNKKKGSAETKYDVGGHNDIKLPYNACGGVYALDLNDKYEATNMSAIITGESITEDADGNRCNLNKLSNPDNVTMLEGTDLLFIGEDTSSHINNVIWSFNLETKELLRVLTTPLDAETTSPFWYKNINGFSYMTAVTQHPMEDVADASPDSKESFIGVLGPIKNIK